MINGPGDTVKRAHKLRRDMSLPERLLWRELKRRPSGIKFRRQHPAGVYVLDFFCAAARLAIEIDGRAHEGAEAVKRDARRSHFLRSQGVGTLRVPARVVLEDMEAAVARIVEVCVGRTNGRSDELNVPLHRPADGPPPRSGEDS